jgi:hypothetical protein
VRAVPQKRDVCAIFLNFLNSSHFLYLSAAVQRGGVRVWVCVFFFKLFSGLLLPSAQSPAGDCYIRAFLLSDTGEDFEFCIFDALQFCIVERSVRANPAKGR